MGHGRVVVEICDCSCAGGGGRGGDREGAWCPARILSEAGADEESDFVLHFDCGFCGGGGGELLIVFINKSEMKQKKETQNEPKRKKENNVSAQNLWFVGLKRNVNSTLLASLKNKLSIVPLANLRPSTVYFKNYAVREREWEHK